MSPAGSLLISFTHSCRAATHCFCLGFPCSPGTVYFSPWQLPPNTASGPVPSGLRRWSCSPVRVLREQDRASAPPPWAAASRPLRSTTAAPVRRAARPPALLSQPPFPGAPAPRLSRTLRYGRPQEQAEGRAVVCFTGCLFIKCKGTAPSTSLTPITYSACLPGLYSYKHAYAQL